MSPVDPTWVAWISGSEGDEIRMNRIYRLSLQITNTKQFDFVWTFLKPHMDKLYHSSMCPDTLDASFLMVVGRY